MYKSFRSILKCPLCRSTNLSVHSSSESEDQVYEGVIHCPVCKTEFQIINGIPLLVGTSRQEAIINNWNTSTEYDQYTLEPTKRVQKLVQDYSRDTVIALDSGCGSGAYTHFFNSKEVICLDLVPYFLRKIRSEYEGTSKLHLVISDVAHLPFKEKSVDVAFCSSVLEHLEKEDIIHVVDNFSNICKKVIIIDVPNDFDNLVLLSRYVFEKLGFYEGRIEDVSDEVLRHHCRFCVNDLQRMNFEVHGCIGWVSRKNIKIGLLWDLYDRIVWSHPSLAGTLIGIKQVD